MFKKSTDLGSCQCLARDELQCLHTQHAGQRINRDMHCDALQEMLLRFDPELLYAIGDDQACSKCPSWFGPGKCLKDGALRWSQVNSHRFC